MNNTRKIRNNKAYDDGDKFKDYSETRKLIKEGYFLDKKNNNNLNAKTTTTVNNNIEIDEKLSETFTNVKKFLLNSNQININNNYYFINNNQNNNNNSNNQQNYQNSSNNINTGQNALTQVKMLF